MPVVPGAEAFSSDGGRVGVLLVHGFTGSPASMRPWGEHLAKAGLTVSCPRLPGHGTRWQDMALTRWQDWYAEIDRSFDELRRKVDEVFVCGLSMGGTLTLRLAEERADEIRGLVLVNPSILTEKRAFRLIPLLMHVLPSIKGVSNDIKKPGVDEVAYRHTPLRAAASLGELWKVTLADLDKVTMPVLFYRSSEDHIVEAANAHEIQSRLGTSDVREVVLHDSYHVATLDNDAPTIFEGSLAFVRELSAVGV